MEVKIKLESSFILLLKACSKLVEVENFWIDELVKLVELTIKILATVAGSEITSDDSIRVEHGDDVKNVHTSEFG